MEEVKIEEVKKIVLANVRVVGWGIIGCSECPFSENPQDVNEADPDEGYYDCSLMKKGGIWGENPICSDRAWVNYFCQLCKLNSRNEG